MYKKISDSGNMDQNINEIEELYRVSQVLSSSLDLKKTLKIVSENLTRLTGAKYCDIYFIDKGNVEHAYSFGKKAPEIKSYPIKDAIFSGKVLAFQKPLEVNKDNFAGYDPHTKEFFLKEDICCVLYLPIIKNGSNIGFVRLYRQSTCSPTIDNKRVLALVNQMAIVIDNSRMHQRLDHRRARWQAIFEDASDGMVITDGNLRILHANESFLKIIKTTRSSIKRRNIKKFFADKSQRSAIEKELADGMQTEKKIKMEVLLEGHGRLIWSSMHVSFTDSTNDPNPRIIFSFEDITKKKELESSKNEFVSIVSHELRTPLTAIRGYLNLLDKPELGKLTKKQQKFLDRIIESSDRMATLVENLLDVNRIDTGKIQLILSPVEITKIFSSFKKDMKQRLKEKNLKLEMKNITTPIFVQGDKDRLYQIVYNLLENAIKYSFPDGKITVGFNVNKEKVIFYVKDNGVGIPPIEQKRLFSKFSRIDNVLSVSSGGIGLGLYIVKNLVTAHKGRIWIESEDQKGASFFVELPLANQLSFIK